MNVTLFTPHKGQKKVIDGFADSEHKFGVVACGRQYGKSLLAQNLMLYWLLSKPNQKAGFFSPIFTQAKKVFNELEAASNKLIKSSNKADLTITFINGSTVQFFGSERYDSIRGFSFNYVVVDEAAFIKEDAVNEAIFPTLSALGKKCLIISTPKSKNWFHTYYLKGIDGGSDYISFAGISTDNPHIDVDFINEQAKSLPADIFAQEYLAQFSEATNDVFRGIDAVCNINNYEQQNIILDLTLDSLMIIPYLQSLTNKEEQRSLIDLMGYHLKKLETLSSIIADDTMSEEEILKQMESVRLSLNKSGKVVLSVAPSQPPKNQN